MATIDPSGELLKKYQWAGKIRFLSFSLLLLFLLLMKSAGGYSYLNIALISLIFIEAILNQPYTFIIKRVNIYRFQYYQMIVDIITITWVIYYMGGLEAPVVSIAYYAVILWAGVVSTAQAVFFAVLASSLFFAIIVVLGYIGLFPALSYLDYNIPPAQMISLLLGNISFFFAFGYFSAHSSRIIKHIERKRQEESLRYAHKVMATGYLVGGFAHDMLNCLLSIRGYVRMLLDGGNQNNDTTEKLNTIDRLERKTSELLYKLSSFSKKAKHEFEPTDINETIEDALELTWPLVRMSHMAVEKALRPNLPFVMADKGQLQEVFVALILNSLDAVTEKGKLTVRTSQIKENNSVEIIFSDSGVGIRQEDLKRLGEPFFTTKGPEKGLGLGLANAYGILYRHNGTIDVKSEVGKGTTFTIHLPGTWGQVSTFAISE